MTFQEVISRFPDQGRRPNGQNGFLVRCPVHADEKGSLSISPGNGSGFLFKCFAGCDTKEVLGAVGLTWQDVLPPREKFRKYTPVQKRTPAKRTRYEIRDTTGELVAIHVREDRPEGKTVWWERPDGTRKLGIPTADLPLYGIERLPAKGAVIVTEGEKPADALTVNGILAVASVTGASGTPGDDAIRPLLSRPVYLWPDNDAAGRKHMARIGASLKRLGATDLRLIDWKAAPDKGDAAEFVSLEAWRDEYDELLDNATEIGADVSMSVVGQADTPELEAFRATDLWNAFFFVRLHGEKVRYCERLGGWHYYDGKRWTREMCGEVERFAKDIPRAMYSMAAAEPEEQRRQSIAKHAARTEAAGKIAAILELAKSEEIIAVPPETFDVGPWLFNAANGTLDLKTGGLRPYRREDMLTNLSPAEWRGADAPAPLFEKFLDETMGGDREKIKFLQRAAGYTLTGDMREQIFLFLYGPEAAGKGTFIRALADVMGTYARSTEIGTFLTSRRDRVRNDVAALVGSRLVTASEPEDAQTFDEGLIKILTGQDKTAARFFFREYFEFTATFKMWLQGNHRPHIRSTGGAMWRRLLIVPFTKSVPEGQRDKTLGEKFQSPEERAGILAWAVKGCLEWQRDGLNPPGSVRAAVAEYRQAEDRLAPFLEERTATNKAGQVPAGKLYSGYKEWCEVNGERPMTKRALGMRLEEKGYKPGRTNTGARAWDGLFLVKGEDES